MWSLETYIINKRGETGDPPRVPTETGANTFGEPGKSRPQDLPMRKDRVQHTRHRLTPLALSIPQREEGLTLSKPPLISRKRVETFLLKVIESFFFFFLLLYHIFVVKIQGIAWSASYGKNKTQNPKQTNKGKFHRQSSS